MLRLNYDRTSSMDSPHFVTCGVATKLTLIVIVIVTKLFMSLNLST